MTGRAAVFALLAAFALPAQDTQHEKAEKEPDDNKNVRFVWKKHPSLRFGDWLRVDFRARFQLDWSVYDPEVKGTPELFNLERRRLAVEGTFLKHFEYEISRELAQTDFPWKDVYGNFRYFRSFQVRGGRFRIPFSMDQLTGPTNLDFVERSRIADRLAPNRDTGILLHGPLGERGGVKYQFGYFFNDGDNAADRFNQRTGENTWAGRVTGNPVEFLRQDPGLFKDLTLGVAYNTSHVPEGLWSLRGRTVSDETFFPYFFVNGRRSRFGTEFEWLPGPFSLKSEYIAAREERKGQGLSGQDLSDLIARGFYVSGTWVPTGQPKAKSLSKGRRVPFISRKGWGAIELATRYEYIRFGSDGGPGRPSRSTRAANVLGNSNRLWTFGVNWYLNQWTKMQGNFVREKLEDPFRSPIQGLQTFWSYKFRLQLAL
ncbi:MAG: porin [Bryobacteraceae bacterium]|nr:porin [Bryobacteraceae bacterium]